jgi:hypothetical protein
MAFTSTAVMLCVQANGAAQPSLQTVHQKLDKAKVEGEVQENRMNVLFLF